MTDRDPPSLHILQFGSTGQVARCVSALAGPDLKVTALAREAVDLTDASAVRRAIAEAAPDVGLVLNAAAYTNVDAAETDRAAAFAVNAFAPGVMAQAAGDRGLPFIHLSTDYVFDGTATRPYRETDPTSPLGVYGASKLAGEEAVLDAAPDSVILRTAWVFSAHGKNFVKTMMRLAADRDEVSVVDDQIGCPTPADAIAGAILQVGRSIAAGGSSHGPRGVFNYCGGQAMSWFDFADAIFERLGASGLKRPQVHAIPTSAYPTPVPRPAYSVLDCSPIYGAFGVEAADSLAGLDRVLSKIS